MKRRWTLAIPVLLLLIGIIAFMKPAAKAAGTKQDVRLSVSEDRAAAVFLTTADKTSDDAKPDKSAGFYIKKFLIAAVIGLIVALISIGVMTGGMKNIRKSSDAEHYVLKDTFKLRVSEDRFLHEEEKRKKKASPRA